MRITDRLWGALAAASAVALAAGSAQAVPQFTPTASARVHTLGSGEPGVVWNNAGIVYTAGTSSLAINGVVDVMNYYDPGNGGCPTDSAGSTCNVNYGPDLNLSILATYLGASVTPVGGGYYDIVLNFQSSGGTDIVWTDPTDGNSVMLQANWVAGTFGGNPTPGLQVSGAYCDGIGGCGAAGVQGDLVTIGFAQVNNSTLYANLFNSGGPQGVLLDFHENFSLIPSVDSIAAYLIANAGALPDFTGQAQGQIFRVDTGEFVIPEPSTALLLGLGLFGMAARGRRAKR
jgi:hypothetical protein